VSAWYLIYDDNCPFCRGWIERVKRLDRNGLVRLAPLSNPPANMAIKSPDKEALMREIHLVSPDGDLFKGADAVSRLAVMFPRTRLAGVILSAPVIRIFARYVYRVVARWRYGVAKSCDLSCT